MRFNKFYNSLDDDQKKYVLNEMREEIEERKLQESFIKGLGFIAMGIILFAITGQISSFYRR